MHRTTTDFPDIDSRSYYSDVTLKHTNIMKEYDSLILQQKYQEASQYLYDNIEVKNINLEYNGAYLWNRIDDQIVALEDYAIHRFEKNNIRPYYSPIPPTPTYDDDQMTWIV